MTSKDGAGRPPYQYTKLDQLQPNTVANVYGVVKHVKPTLPTRVSDYFKTIHVHDESLEPRGDRLTVTVFAHRKEQLPDCQVGDIIRLHRMQIDGFNDARLAKLNVNAGGSWVLFDAVEGYEHKSASSVDPSWQNSEKLLISQLRLWVSGSGSPLPHSTVQETLQSCTLPTSITEQKSVTTNTNYSFLADIKLGSYSCLCCQLLARSLLTDNEEKLALLTVWDGTRCRLNLNTPDMADFTTQTYSNGVIEGLSGLCVNLVVYGDHVKRSKQLKLGAIYRFSGVHCKLYMSVGLPELYIHDRYKILAAPLLSSDQVKVISRLQAVLKSKPALLVDVVTDTRTDHELCTEMLREQPASKLTSSSQSGSNNTTTTAMTRDEITHASCSTARTLAHVPPGSSKTVIDPTVESTTASHIGGSVHQRTSLSSANMKFIAASQPVQLSSQVQASTHLGKGSKVVLKAAHVCDSDAVEMALVHDPPSTHTAGEHYVDNVLLYSSSNLFHNVRSSHKTTSQDQPPNGIHSGHACIFCAVHELCHGCLPSGSPPSAKDVSAGPDVTSPFVYLDGIGKKRAKRSAGVLEQHAYDNYLLTKHVAKLSNLT